MVRECVSRGVREIEEGGIYSGAVRESTRAEGRETRRAGWIRGPWI